MVVSKKVFIEQLEDIYREIQGIKDRIGLSDIGTVEYTTRLRNNSKNILYQKDHVIQNETYKLAFGKILAALTEYNAYEVSIGGSTMYCTTLATLGNPNGSIANSSTYTPGSKVLIAYPKYNNIGLILGLIPYNSSLGDMRTVISNSSRLRVDESRKGLAATYDDPDEIKAEGFTPSTRGYPYDAVSGGEFSINSLTGNRLFLDEYMALLCASDSTGIWLFNEDNFLRIAGANYQILSSGYEEYHATNNDNIELYKGSCLYTWEQLGRFQKPENFEDVVKQNTSEDILDKGSTSAYYEALKDAKPFYRLVEFNGSLGYGKHIQLSAPSQTVEKSKYLEEYTLPGLSRLVQSADGIIAAEAAGGLYLVRKAIIPSVNNIVPFDEVSTDYEDYAVNADSLEANLNISIPVKKGREKSGSSDNTESIKDCMGTLAGILAYNAYIYNYKPFVPFLFRENHYNVPEESRTAESLEDDNTGYLPLFYTLKYSQFLDAPKTISLDISEHQKEQEYYTGYTGLSLLPDNGFNLYNSYGSEVKASGGDIVLATPGDIWLKAGRRIHLWAGNDMSMRIKGSLDISTTDGSIRIKAQQNLEMLGGNAGDNSGVLIESKGSGEDYRYYDGGDKIIQSGIVLKTTGTIAEIGRDLYHKATSGDVVIEAGKRENSTCNGTFVVNARSEEHRLVEEDRLSFYKGYKPIVTYRKTSSQYNIPVYTTIGSDITLIGSVNSHGNINLTGHVFSESAIREEHVSVMDSLFKGYYKQQLYSLQQKYQEEGGDASIALNAGALKTDTTLDFIYSPFKIGNEDVIKSMCFSFRTDNDLNLSPNSNTSGSTAESKDYTVFEDLWQNIHMQFKGSGDGTKWEETPVNASVTGQYPFPGDKYFKGLVKGYCTTTTDMMTKFPDISTDRMTDNGIADAYKNPAIYEEYTTLNNYIITGG